MKKQTGDERRTEILEATCQVVIQRGFAGTRISDVAKQLGVSTSLIHYHFDSKEQLLAEAFAHYARNDLEEMHAEIASAPTSIAQLDACLSNYVPEGSDDVEWMLWIDAWGEALRNPLMKRISQELDEQSCAVLQDVLERGVTSGEFRCPDPHGSATRLVGMIDGLAVQFAAHEGILTRERLMHHVRTVAAAEVGVPIGAFGAGHEAAAPRAVPVAPATEVSLRQLIARACDAAARADRAAWESTWSDDGRWDIDGSVVAGRARIGAAWEKDIASYEWIVQTAAMPVLEVDEDAGEATGRVVLETRFATKDGARGGSIATSHDRFVRTPAGWRFAQRTVDVHDRV